VFSGTLNLTNQSVLQVCAFWEFIDMPAYLEVKSP